MTADNQRLDALIAIHLFNLDATLRDVAVVDALGMNNCHETRIYDINTAPWTPTWRTLVTMWVVPGGPGDYQEIERYSTTWKGMGVVVEAMREHGWQFDLSSAGLAALLRNWRARFEQGTHPAKMMAGRLGDTAPMATALAALRALGVEVAP